MTPPSRKSTQGLSALLNFLSAILLSGPLARAQTSVVWDGQVSNVWGDAVFYNIFTNWQGFFTVPDSTSERAVFDSTSGISGTYGINTGGGSIGTPPWDINGITINTGNSATLNFGNQGRFDLGGTGAGIILGGANTANFAGEIRLDAASTLDNNASGDLVFNAVLVVNAASTASNTSSGDLLFNGATTLADDFSVSAAGSGTTAFNGAVTTSGGSAVELGQSGTADISYDAINVASGTPLTFAHSGSGDAIFDAAIDLGDNLSFTPNSSGTLQINDAITGTGDLFVTSGSSGTVNFSQMNRTFTGDFFINGGTVTASVASNTNLVIGGPDPTATSGDHVFGYGDITIDGGSLDIDAADDHVVLTTGSTLTLNSGALNITTATPQTGNDFRVEYGTFVQTGGTSNFNLGDDYNLYNGGGNQAGQTFISGGSFNVTVRDQFRAYQDFGTNKIPTFSVSNGAQASITLNRERGNTGSMAGVVMANYQGSIFDFSGCGTLITVDETRTDVNARTMVNLAGNTSITDGARFVSNVDVVLNSTLNLTGDNSANTICPSGPGELTLSSASNLYINQSPNLLDAPNIAFDSDSDQGIYSLQNGAAPTQTSGNYKTLANNVGGSGSLTGIGTLRKDGSGTLTLDASMGTASVGAQEIRIEGGTLLLGADNQITDTTAMDLAGGTFNTGGYDETLGTLTLSQNSTLNMGTGSSFLTFADTDYQGGQLTITNWDGEYEGGGTDRIYVNSTNFNGLLQNVYWADLDVWGARQLATGEIVPVPEPRVYIGGAGLLLLAGIHYLRRRNR